MQAYREVHEISADGYVKIKVPAGMGKRVEVILLPAAADSALPVMAPQQNGFCMQVLASIEEDVWNDL